MRIFLAAAVMAAMASRGGCGSPSYDACQGKACGDPCTVCPGNTSCSETAIAKACDAAGECLPVGSFECDAACAGRKCGDACAIEPACYPLCMMPAVLGYCDQAGRCGLAYPACYEPCAGKACGAQCFLCPPNDTTCVETAIVTACNRSGQYVVAPTTCP